MSHEGEKTCPLCAEEMDLTDQQLKPCKCGYEICVWCWHHIMDMAEKDAEGRCPACRTAYNKEKIVGTGAKCERLMVSEMNVDKKHKLHKGKNKTSEGRNQLGNVRVIQRNLVYVVGLSFDFADEDLLQRRDYFGQYGKVLKVSVSRTASGAIQQFANSTCSVYITYSKEEEAVRCIQSVHGFVLDGRPLRACFGTTKYCHVWLRNMSCINPDCLYLHDIGSQEDSLTKDEIVSAYTRSRVQQITSTSNSLQRRSGNVLPPPADEYCNNTAVSSGKPITKTATNTNQNSTSVSPPNSSSGRSAALPAGASWGTRLSTNQTLPTNTPCSDGPVRPKPDTSNGPVALCTSVASPSQVPSSRANIGKRFVHNDESTIPQDKSKIKNSVKEQPNTNKSVPVPESSFAPTHSVTLVINKQPNGPLLSEYPSNNISHPSATSIEPALQKGSNDALNGDVENMCSSILSMSIHENQQLQTSVEAENKTEEVQSDFRLGMPTSLKPVDLHEVENDLLSFESQRVNDPEIVTNRMQEFSNAFHLSKHSYHSADLNRQVVDRDSNLLVSEHNIPIRHSENMLNLAGIDNGGYSNIFPSNGTVNTGKSGIIADILSMDFDPWDDSLTSPTNLANFFGKSNRRGSFGAPGPKKTQHSNQSVFSFAREEQVSGFRQPVDYFEQAFKQPPTLHDFSGSNGVHIDKPVARDGFSGFNSTESEIFSNGHLSINKSAASRSQIAPPPGFPGPSRVPPPPGYTLQDRTEQILDMLPANHMHNSSPFSRNQYQTPLSSNTYSNGDIEFMDPAILAVGRGTLAGGVNNHYRLDMMSSFSPPRSSTYEETRFQSFLQRSLPSHQNQRFNDTGERFSSFGGDAYGHPSRVMDHALGNNHSQFSQFGEAYGAQSRNGVTSNGQWDGWNEIQSGNINVRNDRLGFTNFYAGYEDPKRRMPNSGNLYNGAYGI